VADLAKVIEMLERATGPDARLDAVIACAVKFRDLRPAEPDDFGGKYGYRPGDIKCEHGFLMADRYTRSLDAALTLVPEGWSLDDLTTPDPTSKVRNCAEAEVMPFVGNDAGWPHGAQRAVAPTAPLALCIAALRARMASNG